MRLAFATLVALLALASPAFASSVTNLTVANSTPSAGAGARTVYVVSFTTSAGGALSGSQVIDVSFPPGTGLAGFYTASVRNVTTSTNVGGCTNPGGQLMRCTLFTGQTIGAGHNVTITFGGITNPATPGTGYQVGVLTTADADSVSSPNYSVVAGGPVTSVTLDNASPSRAAGARTQYIADFTVSATGGLSQAANSRISITFPTGTTFAGYSSVVVRDVTTSTNVGNCGGNTGLVIECTLFTNATIGAGHAVRVTFGGITNPSTAGQKTISVSTTSDLPTVNSQDFTVVAAQPVTGVTLDNTSPSTGAGARTQYIADFTASSTGRLSQAANSRISITFPAGTTFTGYASALVRDVTTATNVGNCGGNTRPRDRVHAVHQRGHQLR